MSIRPISAYKKANPVQYGFYSSPGCLGLKGGSKKQEENNFYYVYAFFCSGIDRGTKESPNPFIMDATGRTLNNKTTVAELGRLLLTGWYYNLEEYAKQICGYIDRIYNNTAEKDRALLSGLMTQAVTHLRENLPYYAQHKEEAKLYLLQTLAKDEMKLLEPEKPVTLLLLDKAREEREDEVANNLKKNKRHYIVLAEDQQLYIEYLQELLDEAGIGYLTYEEKMQAVEKELEPFYKKVAALEEEHHALTQAAMLGNKLLS